MISKFIKYNLDDLDSLRLNTFIKEKLKGTEIESSPFALFKHSLDTSSSIFTRIGMFIATVFAVMTGVGFIYLITESNTNLWSMINIVLGIGLLILLEILVTNKGFYRNGIVQALLYSSLGLIFTGIQFIFKNQYSTTFTIVLLIPFLVFAIIRYLDVLCSIVLYISLLALISIHWSKPLAIYLPFVSLFISVIAYSLLKFLYTIEKARYWETQLFLFRIIFLVQGYASLNLFVVDSLSIELLGKPLEGFWYVLFLITSITIPFYYIYNGLKKKDRILFDIGLIILSASLLTIKYYYGTNHPEITLTIVGACLFCIVVGLIKRLKTPWNEITSVQLNENNSFLTSEALIVSRFFSAPSGSVAHHSGGGDTGGGGNEANF